MKAFKFDIKIVVDGNDYRATGIKQRFYAAVPYLRNGDPGYPAEGGEIEDVKLWRLDGEQETPVAEDVVDDLMDDLTDIIDEALDEY